MSIKLNLPSPIQSIEHPLLQQQRIKVWVKRDDLIHPIISGNKWRKLTANIENCIALGQNQVVSFGGAYSNHIHALAFAGKQFGIKTTGIIRGESRYASNYTLRWAEHWGMQLRFVNRNTYRLREDPVFLSDLQRQFPLARIIPEGGSNKLALRGVGQLIDELDKQLSFDYLLCPVGSGGTLAGLIQGSDNRHQILGISVLKQQDYLHAQVEHLLDNPQRYRNWQILNQYHCGGYGKFQPSHLQKMCDLQQQLSLPIEPVYSGKMLLAFWEMMQQHQFAPGSRIVLLHTGGLQGLGGMLERGLISPDDWQLPPSAPEN
ncbi:1-aminocyclopropane-1-carboxylate deaminase/D-cysteine desulfhydrase [Thalassotalea mangrovi]|uniref:Pyridoxal-phosphate dependent enzyme n=1 Tax=Thalassotalea mangrovi TaxID=2572245 RepID=A0A4U1BBB5_9GAMM|nr:pyridoxal-phosphate dependent enzyme [Thalassotalea mangrovi]TKB47872.1 pyridoxal-phosphate dependent enzyme [Thalassotalea mangrovi]